MWKPHLLFCRIQIAICLNLVRSFKFWEIIFRRRSMWRSMESVWIPFRQTVIAKIYTSLWIEKPIKKTAWTFAAVFTANWSAFGGKNWKRIIRTNHKNYWSHYAWTGSKVQWWKKHYHHEWDYCVNTFFKQFLRRRNDSFIRRIIWVRFKWFDCWNQKLPENDRTQ